MKVGRPRTRTRTRLDPERQLLVEKHLPLARRLAASMSRDSPWLRDDILSSALLGLTEAATTFDPSRGISFGFYARRRIGGEISNAIRSEAAAFHYHFPLYDEWEEHTRKPERRIDREIKEGLKDDRQAREIESREAVDAIVRTLPTRHAAALRLLAVEGLTQAEAAGRLGCSQALVGQLVAQSRVFLGGRSACSS